MPLIKKEAYYRPSPNDYNFEAKKERKKDKMGKAKKIMQARETKNKDKMPSGFAETRTLAIACQTAVTPRFAVARHEPS